MNENILKRAREIHAGNVNAGWWSDLKTGECILATRNRPEMLMLTVSELSEANEGLLSGSNDDKLPHLPMFDVELADAAIRDLDLIGAEETVHGEMGEIEDFEAIIDGLLAFGTVTELMDLVDLVSAAMEHYRKRRVPEYRMALIHVLAGIFALARIHEINNLWEIVDEKIAFNGNRADHKVENRRADGGKAF